MSTSTDGDPVGLTVYAADEAKEIFIIDGQFRLVGRGLGRMHANLEPGIYKVKARAGLTTREQHVVLFPGQPQSVNLGPIPFTSPAPLSQTLKTHEYHMGAAQQLSGNIHVRAGEGSSIFVFARDW